LSLVVAVGVEKLLAVEEQVVIDLQLSEKALVVVHLQNLHFRLLQQLIIRLLLVLVALELQVQTLGEQTESIQLLALLLQLVVEVVVAMTH
jgi:hypothetical protein